MSLISVTSYDFPGGNPWKLAGASGDRDRGADADDHQHVHPQHGHSRHPNVSR